jgi:predicted cobalt transporter CbtA
MTGHLLWRGMLAGLLAAFLSGLFALAFAEPQIDRAIALESTLAAPGHAAMSHEAGSEPAEEEVVSRATQKGVGLFTAVMLYGAAVGGLFALVFAYAYGRVARCGPRTLALLMAACAFLVIALVPAFKYPPNPPAVGLHETVRLRTVIFFAMIAFSVMAAIGGDWVRRRARMRLDALDAGLVGIGAYVILIGGLQVLLPRVDEVPPTFPASLLWQFRIASIGAQLVLWLALGILFGRFAEARLRRG